MTTKNDDQHDDRRIDLVEALSRGLGLIREDDRKDTP